MVGNEMSSQFEQSKALKWFSYTIWKTTRTACYESLLLEWVFSFLFYKCLCLTLFVSLFFFSFHEGGEVNNSTLARGKYDTKKCKFWQTVILFVRSLEGQVFCEVLVHLELIVCYVSLLFFILLIYFFLGYIIYMCVYRINCNINLVNYSNNFCGRILLVPAGAGTRICSFVFLQNLFTLLLQSNFNLFTVNFNYIIYIYIRQFICLI